MIRSEQRVIRQKKDQEDHNREVECMSMIAVGSYDNYRPFQTRPGWQKIERYDYCSQDPVKESAFVKLAQKLQKLTRK